MDIKEFIHLSAGKWFSQRSIHHLDEDKTENNKAEIRVEMLPSDLPDLVQLCKKNQINPNDICSCLKVSWDNSVDWGKPKEKGSSIIILVSDRDNPQSGKLLTVIDRKDINVGVGHYLLDEDESLTLMIEDGDTYWQERLWFASENLRLRTSLIKHNNNVTATSFYSEIRKVAPKSK